MASAMGVYMSHSYQSLKWLVYCEQAMKPFYCLVNLSGWPKAWKLHKSLPQNIGDISTGRHCPWINHWWTPLWLVLLHSKPLLQWGPYFPIQIHLIHVETCCGLRFCGANGKHHKPYGLLWVQLLFSPHNGNAYDIIHHIRFVFRFTFVPRHSLYNQVYSDMSITSIATTANTTFRYSADWIKHLLGQALQLDPANPTNGQLALEIASILVSNHLIFMSLSESF